MIKKLSVALLCALAACGGGGSTPTTINAAGTYTGTVNRQTSTCPFPTAEKLRISDIVTLDSTGTVGTVTIADGTQIVTPVTPSGFQYHFDRTSNLGGYGTCQVVNTLSYTNIQLQVADVTLDTTYTCPSLTCDATWFATLNRNA